MMFLSKNWYFSVQKALIYYTVNKSHHNSFILLVFSNVANFRYVANFRFLTLSILASALLMMLHRLRLICLMMYVWPLLSTHSEKSLKPKSLHKHIHPNFCFSWYLSMAMTLLCLRLMIIGFCCFCLVCLESVFRWRLSTIKILL